MRIYRLAGTSLLVLSTVVTCAAYAQTIPSPASPTVNATNRTKTPQGWVEKISVQGRRSYAAPNSSTATRTDTPVIDVPQSVQIINKTLLREQDNRTLTEALANVSGVTPTPPDANLFSSPIIHGFPAEIYLDGLPQFATDQAANDPTSLVGVERIEVVKGPTSTLYGGGLGSPLGGVINVVSERPDLDRTGGYAAIRGGSFSTVDPYGDVNLVLGPTVAARIAGEYQNSDSWIDKVGHDRWSAQPSLLFQIDPATDLVVRGQLYHRSDLEYSGLPAAQAIVGQIDRDAFPGAPEGQPRTAIDNRVATAELHHRFSDTLRLSATGRWSESEVSEFGSFVYPSAFPPDPATPTTYPILPIHLGDRAHEGTFDLNLVDKLRFLGVGHELLGGVNYDRTNFVSDLSFASVPVGSLDLSQSENSLMFEDAGPVVSTQTDHFETFAPYLQDQASYGRLHLLGSVRYTVLHFQEREQSTDQTYYHFSPRAGVTIDVADGLALYGGYETAFRAAFDFMGEQPPVPEKSTNYEAGLKLALQHIGLSGTASLFRQTENNIPTPDPNNPFFSVQTGQQRAQGLDVDLIWEPIPAVSVLATYAYTDSAVIRDANIPLGQQLARVPHNSGRVAIRYRVLNGVLHGLSVGAGVTALDRQQATLPNTVAVPGYATIDVQAAYQFGRYILEVTAFNLGNRHAFDAYPYLGYPVVQPIQPRSAFATLRVNF